MSPEEQNIKRIKKLLNAGSQITGSAIGGALGFYLGGPFGAAAAGAIGSTTGETLSDIATRVLSRREEVRIGATANYAYEQIKINLEEGNKIRKNGFLEHGKNEETLAEELFEGILLKAKREHENKKLKYIGRFYGNVAFDWYCSQEQANFHLNLLERLTYQQLVMIHTFQPAKIFLLNLEKDPKTGQYTEESNEIISDYKKKIKELRSGLRPAMGGGTITPDRYAAYAALFELYQLGLVEQREELNKLPKEPPKAANKINFAETYTSSLGQRLNMLAGLYDIPDKDVENLKKTLDYKATTSIYIDKEKKG